MCFSHWVYRDVLLHLLGCDNWQRWLEFGAHHLAACHDADDSFRSNFLWGREPLMAACAARLRGLSELVWVDLGGGTAVSAPGEGCLEMHSACRQSAPLTHPFLLLFRKTLHSWKSTLIFRVSSTSTWWISALHSASRCEVVDVLEGSLSLREEGQVDGEYT